MSAPTPAGLLTCLRYMLFHAVGLFMAVALMAGGAWITAALVGLVVLYVLGDAVVGDDLSSPHFTRPGALTLQLWMALPLLATIVFIAVWGVSPGDPLGLGAAVQALTGYDALAAREATAWGHRVSAVLLTGLMIGMIGTIAAHELVHRPWDPVSTAVSRWLLAFSFDTAFAIEHVHGHHRRVCTPADPATAPRGRNAWAHILLSTWQGQRSAWHIESERLRRRGLHPLSLRNALLIGAFRSAALVAAAWAMGGSAGALFFAFSGLCAKGLLEVVNYMEHYGLVRDPCEPVQIRHSWNTNRRLSCWALFNLPRHAHHHVRGSLPFHLLQPLPQAPAMLGGYLGTLLVALLPPLWHRWMTPRLLQWDAQHASVAERELARQANACSGLPALQQAARAAPAPQDLRIGSSPPA
jgi:alkane 1-monooxygenase